jgi:hypothetical protein
MRRPCSAAGVLLIAALALALCLISVVDATVVTTCRAATSSDADPWGLAKVAALTGVNNAVYQITRYSSYSVKIGAVCAAITNLVK